MSSQGGDPDRGSSYQPVVAAATQRAGHEEGSQDVTNASDPDVTELVQCQECVANDRADYQLTSGLFRELVGVRFRLLGFLPTVSGAILTVLSALDLAPEVVIGPVLVGLLVTWGLTLYEIRNSQIHDNAVHRSRHLERLLGLSPSIPSGEPGGFFGERTELQLFLVPLTSSPSSRPENRTRGLVPVRHDSALAVVYGVVLASWSAVLAFNIVRWLDEHYHWLDDDTSELAWRVSIGAGSLLGLVGWRTVSALSRTGRNLRIIYRMAPLAGHDDASWPVNVVDQLVMFRREAPRWKRGEFDRRTERGRSEMWQLALALGVVTDRRRTRFRPKLVIERGAVNPANLSHLAGASRRAILGLELAADPAPHAQYGQGELRRRMVRRYGHAPWCGADEVRYRAEWLAHLESATAPVGVPT